MIIIEVSGGLGNQLFQYAFARKLSLLLGCEIKFDVNHFSNNKLRTFELGKLNTVGKIATLEDIKSVRLEKSIFSLLKRKYNTLIRPYYKRNIVGEKSFNFDKNLLAINSNAYVSGYFQTEKYFKSIETILREELTPRANILSSTFFAIQSDIRSNSSVSIHIRRGDYVNNPEAFSAHGICELDYYKSALKHIKSKITDPVFYVFSDDIEWCTQNIITESPTFFINNTQNHFEDLFLMASCKHNIIANSSFSWWGAWLNTNANKIVIAPQKWFNNRCEDTQDLIPESWIQM